MARRCKDWNEDLAQDLRDPKFARRFLLAAVEEGVSIQRALGKVIRATGVREFASRIRMASPNLLRAIHPRHNPTQETLNRLLKPFGLKLSLAPIEKPRNRTATSGSREDLPLTAKVRALKGALRGSRLDRRDHRKHLEDKYS